MNILTGSQSRTLPLSGGDIGTAETIAHMRQLIDAGIKDQQVNRTAIAIAWPTQQFSETPKAQAIYNWMQQNLRFMPDMVGKETLRTPRETLTVRAGDCDDFTILAASLLGTIGIRSRAVTVSSHVDDPQSFSHIYPEAFVDGKWVAMDIARPGAQFGLTPQTYYRKREWDLFSSNYRDVSGLSGYMSRGSLGCGTGCGCPNVSGLGAVNRGNRRLHGLGDATDDIAAVGQVLTPQLVGAVTQGTASIVAATSGVPPGYGYNSYGQLVPLTSMQTPFSGSTLLLLALAIGAIAFMGN
jgi:Transglutaminase-like superfamily